MNRYVGLTSDRLLYAKARFYDPEVGRFTTQDSFLGEINDPPSLHRYFYANARPTVMVDPTGHIAILKKLQDKIEGVQKDLIDTSQDLSDFIQQKTGIKDIAINQKIGDVTGTAAGLVGMASEAVGSVNLAANLWLAPSAANSSLRQEARDELGESIQSIKRSAKVVAENPTGVAFHLVDSGARKGLAALQGDPRATAEVASAGTQIAFGVVLGAEGSQAFSTARRLVGGGEDVAETLARQPKLSQVRALRDLGVEKDARRRFFGGEAVELAQATAGGQSTIGFTQLAGERLRAGIFHVKDLSGEGARAFTRFGTAARRVARSFGAKELELFGAEILNKNIERMLLRRGFKPGIAEVPAAYGGGTAEILSRVDPVH